MAKIIAIANHKGGVAKTTSVACIGSALSRMGKKVLLIDLDAQANLTGFYMKEDEVEESVYNSLVKGEPLPVFKAREGLSIVPSSLELARAEIDLSGRIARERILSKLIKPLEGLYDYILLDCPPSLGIVTTNALVASNYLLIPLTPEALPLKGLKMLDEVVGEVRESINNGLELGGVFVTRYNNRTLNKAVVEDIKARYGEKFFPVMIRENVSVAETPVCGGDLFEYAPESNGAKDYEALTKEIDKRLK